MQDLRFSQLWKFRVMIPCSLVCGYQHFRVNGVMWTTCFTCCMICYIRKDKPLVLSCQWTCRCVHQMNGFQWTVYKHHAITGHGPHHYQHQNGHLGDLWTLVDPDVWCGVLCGDSLQQYATFVKAILFLGGGGILSNGTTATQNLQHVISIWYRELIIHWR